MRLSLMTAAALALAGPAITEHACARKSAAAEPAEIAVPNSRRIAFKSAINGRDYLVSVAIPQTPPPKGGYPVFYLLDSYWMFGSAVDNARLNQPDVMIVGIGYPLDDPAFVAHATSAIDERQANLLSDAPARLKAIYALRTHDLSLAISPDVWRIGGAPEMAESSARLSGGLDKFLDVIEREVKPRVAKIAPVDTGKEALFGHSLGGLAVLHALFTHPERYDSFIAASPSIWAAPVLWDEQQAFGRRVEQGLTPPHILLTMGEKEQDGPAAPAKMVDNMREMARRLRTIQSLGKPLPVQDVVFTDEDHGSVQQPSVSRAIAFAFGKAEQ